MVMLWFEGGQEEEVVGGLHDQRVVISQHDAIFGLVLRHGNTPASPLCLSDRMYMRKMGTCSRNREAICIGKVSYENRGRQCNSVTHDPSMAPHKSCAAMASWIIVGAKMVTKIFSLRSSEGETLWGSYNPTMSDCLAAMHLRITL